MSQSAYESARGPAERIRRRELTAVEALDAQIERIEAHAAMVEDPVGRDCGSA